MTQTQSQADLDHQAYMASFEAELEAMRKPLSNHDLLEANALHARLDDRFAWLQDQHSVTHIPLWVLAAANHTFYEARRDLGRAICDGKPFDIRFAMKHAKALLKDAV